MTASSARQILVVDDEEFIRKLISDMLTGAGHEVDTAEDGAIGLLKLQAKDYDLLVTDNKMPRVTGVELVQKIRAARITVPIIMVTATPPENIEELELAGVLEKPFGINRLVWMVNDVLHQALQKSSFPNLKKIARQLLVAETSAINPSKEGIWAVFHVFNRLRSPLSHLMGSVGFHSLLTRALALTNEEIQWLHGVQINDDGSLEGLQKVDLRTAAAAETMLVAHMLGLLVILIGPSLTLQLLYDTWPSVDKLKL